MAHAKTVDFFDISDTRSVLDEFADELTERQMARLAKAGERLEAYGWQLNGDYFSKVQGAKEKLWEYRLTLDRVEYRILFAEEPGDILVMLVGYKERRNSVPKAKIQAAEARLQTWRERRKKSEVERQQPRQK